MFIRDYSVFIEKKHPKLKPKISAGRLLVSSGELVICDPLVQPARRSLKRKIPPGNYEVFLYPTKKTGLFAFAELKIRRAKTHRWEMAILSGDKISDLADDGFYGYAVDAGIGCFMDKKSARRMIAADKSKAKKGNYTSYYDDVIRFEMGKKNWCNHYPHDKEPHNVVMFGSGGDGIFPSYWGLDANGVATSLITDFFRI